MQSFNDFYAKKYPIANALADGGVKEHVLRRDIAYTAWKAAIDATGVLGGFDPAQVQHSKQFRQHIPFVKPPRRKNTRWNGKRNGMGGESPFISH